jgi:hypothetical protein
MPSENEMPPEEKITLQFTDAELDLLTFSLGATRHTLMNDERIPVEFTQAVDKLRERIQTAQQPSLTQRSRNVR